MRSPQKTMALWAILVVVAVLLFQMYESQRIASIQNFDFTAFQKALVAQQIKSVTIHLGANKVSGEIKEEFVGNFNNARKFQFTADTEGFRDLLKDKNVDVKYIEADSGLFTQIFLNWLPLILIVVMFMFLFRQIQAGGGKAMSFGKARARLLTENKNRVTFKDVAGVEEAKEELQEIVQFLKDPRKFTRLGGRIPKGVLLVGSPGTGKTLLARAIAGEAEVPFFTISGSDFVEMFVGVGASRVRDLFEQGKKQAPCLIFIDEIDAVGRHRGAGMGGGHDEREQTLNQLLVEMDGFESNEGVILIAATNRPDVLDPALLRPGRFDRRVVVNKPDIRGREMILRVHTRKTPLASDVALDRIAKGTPGFSGADLENLVNEAALLAARKDKHKIEMSDFELAKDKVLMGSERKSMVISEEDKRITAYHEAGHTLVGKMLKGMDPIHKVTIIPRGMALGVTQTLPDEDSLNLSKSKATNMISFLFGGRAAEEVIFKDFTTGAGNDIERATELARRMVCEWGMSDRIGPLALEKREGPIFLGMHPSATKDYSDSKAQEIDAEIKRLITEGHDKAINILTENIDKLHALANALLEHESIDGEEVELICTGASLDELNKRRGERKLQMDREQKAAAEKAIKDEEVRKQEEDKKSRGPVGSTGPVTA